MGQGIAVQYNTLLFRLLPLLITAESKKEKTKQRNGRSGMECIYIYICNTPLMLFCVLYNLDRLYERREVHRGWEMNTFRSRVVD